jgi:serine/threonine protein kinase
MNAIKAQIEEAILNLTSSVSIGLSATFDEVKGIIRTFIRKHPEIFWFSHKYTYIEDKRIVKFHYNFTQEEVQFINEEIWKVLKKDFQVDFVRTLSELEKLVYVYKWITKRTTYNEYSSYNQTIYSVLINRNSVCTGYAKTAQYLLSQVGINSRLVYGKFNCDKTEFGRHGWNVVQINDSWYHVDFCLADASLRDLINDGESPIVKDSVLWNYFGVSTNKILTNRTIEEFETIPNCDKTINDIPDVTLKTPTERLICCKSNSGTSSIVYLDSFDKNVVIKVPRDNQHNLINNEAKILRQLSGSRHIVKLIFANDRELGLEQLTPWGELLNSTYYNPSDSTLRAIIHQLITGLLECKQKGICYSDIHYNNVFVSSEGIYKWGDFGLAFSAQEWNYLPKIMFENGMPKGSQWFMAPETYHSGIFNEASAIYAVSMMAYFVMNDMRPPFWSGVDHQIDALKERFDGHEIPVPTNASRYRSLWPIIGKNLSFDISKRDQSFLELLHQLQKASNDEDINISVHNGNNIIAESNLENCSLDTFARTAIYPGISQDLGSESNDSESIPMNDCSPDTFAQTAAYPRISQDLYSSSDDSESTPMNDCSLDTLARTAIYPGISQDLGSESNDSESIPMNDCSVNIFAITNCFPRISQDSGIDDSEIRQYPTSEQEPNEIEYSYRPLKNPSTKEYRQNQQEPLLRQAQSLQSSRSFLRRLKDKFIRSSKNNDKIAIKDFSQPSIVNACVYAPAQIKTNKSFIIRVYLYKSEEADDVDSKIKEIDP